MKRVHVRTDYGVEGWVTDPTRRDTAIVIGCLAVVLLAGACLGYFAGAARTLAELQ